LRYSGRSAARFYQPATAMAPRFGFAYAPFWGRQDLNSWWLRMFYDKVEGNLIFSQFNLPPFVSTPNFDNAIWQIHQVGLHPHPPLSARSNASNPNLKIPYSMNSVWAFNGSCQKAFFVEATYVGNNGRI